MPLNIDNARALFVHQLGELLSVEQAQAEEVLPELRDEVADDELRKGFEHHLEETREQLQNVERAFEALGETPAPQPSHALNALRKQHDQLSPKIQQEGLRDLFDAGAAARTEHLEIAAYRSLITMAQAIGEGEIVKLLQHNCEQEEHTLQELEQLSERLGRATVTSA